MIFLRTCSFEFYSLSLSTCYQILSVCEKLLSKKPNNNTNKINLNNMPVRGSPLTLELLCHYFIMGVMYVLHYHGAYYLIKLLRFLFGVLTGTTGSYTLPPF